MALLIGIALASTFFAGIDIKANATAKQALDQELSHVYVDLAADVSALTIAEMLEVEEKTSEVEGVKDTELISGGVEQIRLIGQNTTISLESARISAISRDSQVYSGWTNKPAEEPGENETYVSSDAPFAGKVSPGNIISVTYSLYSPSAPRPTVLTLNLTVKGLAQLDDRAHSIASGLYSNYGSFERGETGVLLVDWENTMRDIIASFGATQGWSSSVGSSVLIYIDRDSLLTPWDISTSTTNIQELNVRIESVIESSTNQKVYLQDFLASRLMVFQYYSLSIRTIFTIVSLPIFFVAWYMGTTVSDVSFNLRRREIGLLLTKGFSRGQILGMFLTQTILLGVVGGLLGVLFGFLLNPVFAQTSLANAFSVRLISEYTLIMTVAFGIAMALFSMYSSARKASRLPTIEALREYLLVEEEKAYKKRWPWLAFILGTYKIVVFSLGINMTQQLSGIMFRSGNFIIALLIILFMFVDAFLSFTGPLLFFWGFTKLFVQVSIRFQELTTRVAKFLGDLGTLATKSVRRNPSRSAKIAFLIALIVGYSVQVTGQLASEQDFAIRNIYYSIGADLSVSISDADVAQEVHDNVVGNVSAYVQASTTQYSFSTYGFAGFYNQQMKAIDPDSWPKTAYYEDGWFSGESAVSAFNSLAADNDTIVLAKEVARVLKSKVGSNVTITFAGVTKTLRVVGFYGLESSGQQQIVRPSEYLQQYVSIVAIGLYREVSHHVSADARILVKLKNVADGKIVAENIRALDDERIGLVDSFAESWETSQGDVMTMSTLDVQKLGIVFAFLAASAGTGLVSIVSMKEREREATIMSVRGLSYKQLVVMFLTENFALVTFSVILGLTVGILVTNGNIASMNASSYTLVQRRLVFPLDMSLLLVSCVLSIFMMTILPTLIMARKYVTKLERMVRLR